MRNIKDYRTIYSAILDVLENGPKSRRELINAGIDAFSLTAKELSDNSTNARLNVIRSMCGTVINEMHSRAMISRDKDFLYHKKTEKPIAIRMERCEEEILKILRESSKTRAEIKDYLIQYFGTDDTPSPSDDNKLLTFMGQILKNLVNEGLIDFDGSVYRIVPARTALVKSREEILSLKSDFLGLIHSKGGEFFENYFMNLLSKYLIRSGKTVTESYVTGGSADGGIDGIAKTVDSLGFKETIMVQTKNRIELTVETDVRAFYGAVCAAQGSRGIFATTSNFHPMAKKLLESIDNCVGITGEKIFTMAVDTAYGLKRVEDKLVIDTEVFE